MKKNLFLFLLISFSGFGFLYAVNYAQESSSPPVKFYKHQKGVYVVEIDTEKCTDCIIPYVAEDLQTVKDIALREKSYAAINAGYFDTVNHKTASYVIKEGKTTANPEDNENLMQNPSLAKYIPQILNRSEFRIMNCLLNTGKSIKYYDIALHNGYAEIHSFDNKNKEYFNKLMGERGSEAAVASPKKNNPPPSREGQGWVKNTAFEPNQYPPIKCEIQHSIQAGPMLLPEMDLEKEAFIVRQNGKVIKESAGVLHKYARSAVAIKGTKVLLIAVSIDAKMTIKELQKLAKELGAEKALAFDGGSSTSMFVNLPDKPFELNSAKDNQARLIKSALLVKFSSGN